jgi:hypothetical protein
MTRSQLVLSSLLVAAAFLALGAFALRLALRLERKPTGTAVASGRP